MFARVRKFVIVFGLCAITVSLFSGCATGRGRVQANLHDLDHFQPNCKLKSQQIAFLQSLRPDPNSLTLSSLSGRDRQTNWIINSHLLYLSQYC